MMFAKFKLISIQKLNLQTPFVSGTHYADNLRPPRPLRFWNNFYCWKSSGMVNFQLSDTLYVWYIMCPILYVSDNYVSDTLCVWYIMCLIHYVSDASGTLCVWYIFSHFCSFELFFLSLEVSWIFWWSIKYDMKEYIANHIR